MSQNGYGLEPKWLRTLSKDILGPDKERVIDDNLELAIQVLQKLAKFEVIHVVKTWANSWAASYRFHEARRLPCLLGCPDGRDSMAHYQACLALRTLVLDSMGKGDDWLPFDDLGSPRACALRDAGVADPVTEEFP